MAPLTDGSMVCCTTAPHSSVMVIVTFPKSFRKQMVMTSRSRYASNDGAAGTRGGPLGVPELPVIIISLVCATSAGKSCKRRSNKYKKQ